MHVTFCIYYLQQTHYIALYTVLEGTLFANFLYSYCSYVSLYVGIKTLLSQIYLRTSNFQKNFLVECPQTLKINLIVLSLAFYIQSYVVQLQLASDVPCINSVWRQKNAHILIPPSFSETLDPLLQQYIELQFAPSHFL